MKSVLQRVSEASVTVGGEVVGRVGPGMLVLFGVEKGDDASKLDYHVKKLLNLRIFADEAGKMNRSVQDIGGGLLIVSQFTLAGDCRKGNRPGFDNAMPPAEAERLYAQFVALLQVEADRLAVLENSHVVQSQPVQIATGRFGAMMQVALVNDGPVTFLLEN